MVEVSIVVPTVNEVENIALLLESIEGEFQSNDIDGEIVVVDDQSSDGTADKAREVGRGYDNVKVIERKIRDGLGNALKRGVSESSGDLVIFMDADLSHEPKEIPNFIRELGDNDLVIGSRYISGSRLERGLLRKVISGVYNIFAKNVLGISIADITSGYRGFRRERFLELDLKTNGPEIHSELVVKASIAKYKVSEIPVSYVDRTGGRSKLNYLNIAPGYSKVILEALISKTTNLLR
jgi:dolichol-phosphate mannosyltransferase